RALQRRLVGGRLHHAQLAAVALRAAAGGAHLVLGERVAFAAVAHVGGRLLEGARDDARALAVVLQQVEGHARGGLGAHPGEAPPRLHQCLEGRFRQWASAQNGSFMPGGRPAVSLPIFSWVVSSALRTAALKAAATRSSSMSLSSPSRLGSMVTRLTSCLQVMTTFTRPAPDSPLTSMLASSSCAFFMLSCIAWACFMRPASCPLLNMVLPSVSLSV